MTAGAGAPAGGGGPARALRIGLTGPIGCGKSTIAGWLATRGAVVIDADDVARVVSGPGTGAHDAILATFGREVADGDGTVDRAALAAIVFSDPRRLADLERIVHPAVHEEILRQLRTAERAGSRLVVIEAIRLVEGGLVAECDEVWLVTCDRRVQLFRLAGRGMAQADMDRRMDAQRELAPGARAVATRVIVTDGTPAITESTVAAALRSALEGHG